MLVFVGLARWTFFGSWISTVYEAGGTKEVWDVPFVTGVGSCWIGSLYSKCLLWGSTLVQSVLDLTCGLEGVKILIFEFSTFSLIFVMYFCFGVFIADEFVGGVVMIGIILDMFSCSFFRRFWYIVLTTGNSRHYFFCARMDRRKYWFRLFFSIWRMLRMYRIEFIMIVIVWQVSLVCGI